SPSRAWMLLLLGLVPAIAWLPKGVLEADAAKPPHAVLCGVLVTGLNLVAGGAGPLLDIFFVRTALTRPTVGTTKAATQVLSHLAKIIFYGAPLFLAHAPGLPPWYFFVAMTPLAMLGAVLGGRILDRLTDKNFLRYTKYIVTLVGLFYLYRAAEAF